MRRFLFASLLMFAPIASIALGQEAPPPPEQPGEPKEAPAVEKKKVDPWAVEKPVSAPEGEPVALKISMDPAIEHHMTTDVVQNMNMMGQPIEFKIKAAFQLKLGSSEAGVTSFAMPIDLQNLTVRGQDQTDIAKQSLTNPTFTGKFDSSGEVVASSVKQTGMPPEIERFLKSSVDGVLSFAGTRQVRKGEVWELDAAKFAPRVNGSEGGTITGKVYMKLKGTKDVGGAQCADIAGVFSIMIKGATIKGPAGPMPADVKIKGECAELCGLDGVVRSRVVNLKIEIAVQGMAINVTATTKMTGGPKKASTKSEEASAK